MKLTLEIEPLETLSHACEQAQGLADRCGWPISFRFNSVECVAVPDGDAELLAERQSAAQRKTIVVRSKGGSAPELIETENV